MCGKPHLSFCLSLRPWVGRSIYLLPTLFLPTFHFGFLSFPCGIYLFCEHACSTPGRKKKHVLLSSCSIKSVQSSTEAHQPGEWEASGAIHRQIPNPRPVGCHPFTCLKIGGPEITPFERKNLHCHNITLPETKVYPEN